MLKKQRLKMAKKREIKEKKKALNSVRRNESAHKSFVQDSQIDEQACCVVEFEPSCRKDYSNAMVLCDECTQ